MARHAWLALGLLTCLSCGGKVVSMEGADARMQTEVPPPQRGTTDASVGTATDTSTGGTPDVSTPPPPPVDAGVDLRPPPVDLGSPVDRQPDIVIVVDAAPDVPVVVRCTSANPNCPAGTVCMTPNCGNNGTCVATTPGTAQDPVCGCDRITYWNGAVAAASMTSVRADGACPNINTMSIACGGLQGANCPMGSFCNLEQANQAACNINSTGRCWTLPATCPAEQLPGTRRCVGGGNNPPCQSMCDLIQMERVFTVDPTCPTQ